MLSHIFPHSVRPQPPISGLQVRGRLSFEWRTGLLLSGQSNFCCAQDNISMPLNIAPTPTFVIYRLRLWNTPALSSADAQYSAAPTGTDQFQEGTWMWMAGQDVSTSLSSGYTNWAIVDGEPNNLNPDRSIPANCVRISFPAPFLWRDVVRACYTVFPSFLALFS
jgi:hypothetical protein